PLWASIGSTLMAITLTLRFLNSGMILATVPSSVVHTGVKSLGCEKRIPQLLPSHSWKLIGPSVVSAVKFGASSPNRNAIGDLLIRRVYKRMMAAAPLSRPHVHGCQPNRGLSSHLAYGPVTIRGQ